MKRITGYILTALIFSSCVKEKSSNAFVPYPATDTVWHVSPAERFLNAADTIFSPPAAETASVNTGRYDTARFSGNLTVCTTPGFCVTSDGSAVQGSVTIELLQLSKKGDFVRYGKPTISDDQLLDKQTVFRVKLTQNNVSLVLKDKGLISIRHRTSLISGHVAVLSGDTTLNDATLFNWEETTDVAKSFEGTENNQPVSGYEIPCSKLGWISLGKLTETKGNRLIIIQPVTCTNANTAVYAVFKNQRTVVRLTPEVTSRTFFANNIPAGTELYMVSLSSNSTGLYMGVSSVIMPLSNAVLKMKPEKLSKQQISDFLDGL